MKDYVYLDNAAKTYPLYHRSDYDGLWFNSNMPYATKEYMALINASKKIKQCLHVKSGKILFFRCATDIANWLKGCCGCSIKCSKYEHDSVYDNQFVSLTSQPIFKEWYCYEQQLVNQMTGVIYDIENSFMQMPRGYSFFFSDITAAIGHIVLPSNFEQICDAVWFDGIKFHTEGGIAALWISDRFSNIMGASIDMKNQYNLLHGTVDIEGACMLADAMENACKDIKSKEETWRMLTDIIIRDLHQANVECSFVANNQNRTHAINALQFEKINGDALATFLASKKIYIGKGSSACAEDNDYRVLNAYGLSNEEASHVVRISFDESTTIHEIVTFIESTIEFYKKFY